MKYAGKSSPMQLTHKDIREVGSDIKLGTVSRMTWQRAQLNQAYINGVKGRNQHGNLWQNKTWIPSRNSFLSKFHFFQILSFLIYSFEILPKTLASILNYQDMDKVPVKYCDKQHAKYILI